jgi:ribose transport system substrate-binding protein
VPISSRFFVRALAALRAAGKTRANQFLGGIDGEPEAVLHLKRI